MKKLFSAFALAMGLFTNASAQKHEIYGSYGKETFTAGTSVVGNNISFSSDDDALSFGYNYMLPFHYDDYYFVLGGKLTYMWDEMDNIKEDVVRFQIPLSLKYNMNLGSKVALEPYVGLNLSLFLKHTLSGPNDYGYTTTIDVLESEVYNTHEFLAGFHIGADLCFSKRVVVGVAYEKDFTDYQSVYVQEIGKDIGGKFSSLYFKLGYRF